MYIQIDAPVCHRKGYFIELNQVAWNRLQCHRRTLVEYSLTLAGAISDSIEYSGKGGRYVYFDVYADNNPELVVSALRDLLED